MDQADHPNPQPPYGTGPKAGTLGFLLHLFGLFGVGIPALFVLGVISFLLVLLTGLFGYVTGFITLLSMVLIASSVQRLRTERNSRLMGYIEIATRLNLPLPEFLDALQRGEGSGLGRRARWIANDLRNGFSLGQAMLNHAPDIPQQQTVVIWRGEQAGRLRESAARVAENASRRLRDLQTTSSDIAVQYGMLVLVVLVALGGAVGVLIMPKYIEIFNDFDADLPWVTRFTFQWAQTCGPLFLLGSSIALLGMVGWSTYVMFGLGESVLGPLRRIAEPLWWRVPVVANTYRHRALADACFAIEQAMRAGRPLPDAIDAARHPAQSGVLDKRLRRLAERLRAGKDLPDAARAARLPDLVAGMLGTASASSNPADVFAFLSRYYTQRVSPAEAIVRASALPIATLLTAVCVAWFVFAIFYPLIVLIEKSIQHTGYA